MALERCPVAAERGDPLLDAGAAGVEQAHNGGAVLKRHVLDLRDLLCMRLAKRAAEHRKILGEYEHCAPVHRAPTGHHPVAWNLGLSHAEVVGAMFDEHVELFERVVIEEEFDALARGELALGVLRGDALLAAAETGALAASVEAGEHLFHQWLRSVKLLLAPQLSTTSGSLEWDCLCAALEGRLALRRAALVPRSVPRALPPLAAGL